jgi:peptidyl-prolyl cis-trans isomerase C
MKKLTATIAGTLMLILTGCSGGDANSDARLVQLEGERSSLKVNGEAIPEALVQAYARKRGWELRDPGQREQAYDQLAELLAVAMEARKQGMLADAQVLADLELERLNRLSGLMIERGTQPVTEEDLRAAYDQELSTTGAEEMLVAHILVESAEKAAQVLAALQSGSSFDELLSAQAGQTGVRDAKDLGWVRRTQLPPALAEALSALEAGTYTPQAIATEFGFHVALLRSRRPFNAPPFEQVREGIRSSLTRKRALELGQQIRQQAKIEH